MSVLRIELVSVPVRVREPVLLRGTLFDVVLLVLVWLFPLLSLDPGLTGFVFLFPLVSVLELRAAAISSETSVLLTLSAVGPLVFKVLLPPRGVALLALPSRALALALALALAFAPARRSWVCNIPLETLSRDVVDLRYAYEEGAKNLANDKATIEISRLWNGSFLPSLKWRPGSTNQSREFCARAIRMHCRYWLVDKELRGELISLANCVGVTDAAVFKKHW